MQQLRPALVIIALSTLVLGIAWPLGTTALASVVMPVQAGGSLVVDPASGVVVGSRFVGQQFSAPHLLHGRPSATPEKPYNALASSGSNLGPTNPALKDRVVGSIAELGAEPGGSGGVHVERVTTSGSGLDPHIAPAAAHQQAARIAQARGIDVALVHKAIADATIPRALGIFGEPVVDVLAVNLALARLPTTIATTDAATNAATNGASTTP